MDGLVDAAWTADPRMDERVAYWIDHWEGRGAQTLASSLARLGYFRPVVEPGLAERGLPTSLLYLPVVESDYIPVAASSAGAVGLWQLTAETAIWMGMRVDRYVDERRDPVRSTRIALDYLLDLRDRFGSWHLALSAYNAGPGRVERLIDRYAPEVGDPDEIYWKIEPELPRETRDFVPKFVAVAMVAESGRVTPDLRPEARPARWADGAFLVDEVEVSDATALSVAAEAAGVDLSLLTALNPHILRGYTPFGSATVLRVPLGTGELLRAGLARIPPEERVRFVEHRIRSGETLTHLSARYGVPVAELTTANPGIDPRRLQIGQWVVVPIAATQAPPTRVAVTNPGRERGSFTYTVQKGDTLWSIARLHGIPLDDLFAANGIGGSTVIRPGDRLLIPSGG